MATKSRLARAKRQARIRSKISGTAERPRLNVFRSLNNIFAQVIDDDRGHTLVSASTIDRQLQTELDGKSKTEQAQLVGKALAERSRAVGIEVIVFDRGGYRYHGRVKALAEAAREGGLQF